MKFLGIIVSIGLTVGAAFPAAAADVVTGAGSTFVYPLLVQWVAAAKQAIGVTVNYLPHHANASAAISNKIGPNGQSRTQPFRETLGQAGRATRVESTFADRGRRSEPAAAAASRGGGTATGGATAVS